ncbi:YpoC family protein [Bacillus songklensis]|uniref:YpoC family protein n=1 Tax=Bacillus songklensis TaxID=1069116 RepID=A0ABV8B1P4_9BACI
MNKKITIPASFQHPLFFEQGEIELAEKQSFEEVLGGIPFFYDFMLEAGEGEITQPWEEQEIYVPKLFNYWKDNKDSIGEYFKKRDRIGALRPMILSLGHFISALFWTNGTRVQSLFHLKEEIKKLQYKPINTEGRVTFLLEQPNQYHSYIQLGELYQELTKIYHKMLIMKKRG